ncbi:hypothetical protein KC343_g11055 [Hortaea werneckii]|nr:hypothetical protein KC323_g6905 [Hortaea werneckii]KAI7348358.1 hypothetical protein KC320_g6686 [Hortaea werneckii]KAI7558161.1 hypothetical protein KC317_g11176 [Hortaea werneckii]KAI7612944.1 hypothetical protein KC343_g11055 [Hortaea werneckii]KAI7696659.1 hypothetical protein KC322_g9656 [Hortaea werneckii]
MAGKKTQDTEALAADIEKLSLGTTDKRKKYGPRYTQAKDAGQAAAGTGSDNQQTAGQRYLPPHQRKNSTAKAKTPGTFSPKAPAFTPVNGPASPAAQKASYNEPHKSSQQPYKSSKTGSFNPILFNPAFFTSDEVSKPKSAPMTPRKNEVDSPQQGLASQEKPSTPTSSKSPKRPHLKLIPRPIPTFNYVKTANEKSKTLDKPRPLLIILDLNGTLLFRKSRGASFVGRPKVQEFLQYLLAKHKVMVWSSATPTNVELMCEKLFAPHQKDKLVGIWGRDKLHLTPAQYNQKVQVYKQLRWAWRDHIVASSAAPSTGEWDQENTVLIDDSEEKAASEPYNLLKIDEYEGTAEQDELDVLGQVVEYLEKLSWQSNVSAYMREHPFQFDKEAPAFNWLPTLVDML